MTTKCGLCGRETHPRNVSLGRCIRCEEMDMDVMADMKAEIEGLI